MRERLSVPIVEPPAPRASLVHTPSLMIQRKCACGGSAGTADHCDECAKPAVSMRSGAQAATDTRHAPDAGKTTPSPEPAQVPGFIVEDGTVDLKPGQMRKSDFLAQLREEVCRTAEEALAGTGRSTAGCPYLDYWFYHYGGQSAGHIEKALLRYAPAAATAASAHEYIAIAAERARLAVIKWVRTGEIDAPKEAMAAPRAGRVLFKAKAGGARQADSPVAVQQQLGGGAALPGDVRGRMESVFGHDFSRVRLHADAGANRLATSLNAYAFTIGGDVAFAAGTYQPGTPAGDALIAHELAHVVQQSGAPPESGSTQVSGAEYRALEEDADRSAAGAVASLWSGAKTVTRDALPRIRSGLSLQRCSKCDPDKEVIPQGKIKPAALPSFDCSSPKRVPYSTILQDNEGPTTALALTKVKDIELGNRVDRNSDHSCKLTWVKKPAFALRHYEVTEPMHVPLGKETPSKGRCVGKTLTRVIDIDEAMTRKLAEGEREHCEDSRQAYAKTFARVEQFYNELAEKDFCPRQTCAVEVKERYRGRMGIEEDSFASWQPCFFEVTGDRDAKGFHTAKPKEIPAYSEDCSEALYSFDPATALPEVGSVRPSGGSGSTPTDRPKHSYEDLLAEHGCGDDGTRP